MSDVAVNGCLNVFRHIPSSGISMGLHGKNSAKHADEVFRAFLLSTIKGVTKSGLVG